MFLNYRVTWMYFVVLQDLGTFFFPLKIPFPYWKFPRKIHTSIYFLHFSLFYSLAKNTLCYLLLGKGGVTDKAFTSQLLLKLFEQGECKDFYMNIMAFLHTNQSAPMAEFIRKTLGFHVLLSEFSSYFIDVL